ncbi:MAG: L-threonylcarbamoyladenylate synthase, partial [Syntrophothermus sp.]
GRDESKRFILLADNLDLLFEYAHVVLDKHFDFLHAIWPNPVSVVLNLKPAAVKLLGTPTAAFRIPHHRFCRNLISEIKKPLISTSVNRSGEEPHNEVDPINYEFGPELDGIFYSIHQPLGTASTILDLTGNAPVLIREGSVKFRDLMEVFP